jgi:hypothetical protein
MSVSKLLKKQYCNQHNTIMDSKDIKRNIPMVKLPWYGNLPNAFIQETVFATILKCSNPEKPWIKIDASSTENYRYRKQMPSGH